MITFKPGQTWRTRGGKTCTIVLVNNSTVIDYPIRSDLYTGHWHGLDGTSILADGGIDHEDDLIELLSIPTKTMEVHLSIPLSSLQQIKTALEAGPEAAKNRSYQVCGDHDDHNRLLAWHDNEVFITEQALEQINAKLNPSSHPT